MRRVVGRWTCAACRTSSRQYSTSAPAAAAVASERSRLSYAPIRGPVQRYNALISRLTDKGNLAAALHAASELKQTLARLEEVPDTTTYEALAKAFAVHGLYIEAVRLIDDAKAAGVDVDIGVFNQVLRAHIVADQPLSPVFALMASANIEPNLYTKELIIQHYVHKKSVEAAVRALLELAMDAPPAASTSKSPYNENSLNFSKVSQGIFDSVQRLVCDVGETKLATGLLMAYQQSALQPASHQVLYGMVEAGINHDDPNCTWKAIQVLGESNLKLNEGLAIAALNHFSNHALVDACETVYKQHLLSLIDAHYELQEWHIAPLVKVNLAAGRLQEALLHFTALSTLPSRHTASIVRPSYRIFHAGLQHLSVVKDILQQLQQRVLTLESPIQLINALLKACGQHRLFNEQTELAERVLSKQMNYPKPDLATFQILLESCLFNQRSQDVTHSNISRAQEILEAMRTDFPRIKPDHIVYELLIKLYLQGGNVEADLETAFDYLEEMKHFNMLPSAQVYTALLDRLMSNSKSSDPPYDDARIDLLLQEMASLSYLGGRRHGYARTKLPTRFYESLGKERINEIRDNFFASRT